MVVSSGSVESENTFLPHGGGNFTVLGLYFIKKLKFPLGGIPHVMLRLSLIGLIMVTAFFSFLYFKGNQAMSSHPYPRDDGLIADFTSGRQGPARTALDSRFSLFSDSVWNLHSKVWYERIDEESEWPPNGFIRVNYALVPASGREPYVGIYADLSFPPPILYDVSRFHTLTVHLRSSQPVSNGSIRIAFVLYSANVNNHDYAFATWYVPPQSVGERWTTIGTTLNDFVRPHFVNYDVALDPKRVYRIGIVIFGPANQLTKGYIDIDELRFR